MKAQDQPGAAKYETVYSEKPAVWYEAAGSASTISGDGQWGLYFSPYMRAIRLIDSGCSSSPSRAWGARLAN